MKATISKRKFRFVSPWDYDPKMQKNSVTGGVSMTVPNQSMSVREIMIRFTRGVPPKVRDGGYNDEFIPDVDAMDLAEREAFVAENAERVRSLEKLAEEAKAFKDQPLPAPAASGPRSDKSDVDPPAPQGAGKDGDG